MVKVFISIAALIVLVALLPTIHQWVLIHGWKGKICAEQLLTNNGITECDYFSHLVISSKKNEVHFSAHDSVGTFIYAPKGLEPVPDGMRSKHIFKEWHFVETRT
jgi:hypothetical protein